MLNSKHLVKCQFPGNSELAKLMRSFDWSKTDLPPIHKWGEELQISIKRCLNSDIPIVIFLGPNFTILYNDFFIPFLGNAKHPYYLGKSGKECFIEIWDTIEPMLQNVCNSGKPACSDTIKMFLARKSTLEETYVRFNYSPIFASDSQTVEGIFCSFTEITEQIINKRRLELLRKLPIRSVTTKNVKTICEQSANFISQNADDITFAAIYILDVTETQLNLIASAGLINLSLFPETVGLSNTCTTEHPVSFSLQLSTAFYQQRDIIISNLCLCGFNMPEEEWPAFTNQMIIVPIPAATLDSAPVGVLVVGVNPQCVLNEAYRLFIELVARHISMDVIDAKNKIELDTMIYLHTIATQFIQEWMQERTRWMEVSREMDRRKDNFMAMLSHELRNPLAAISNSSFIISQTAIEDDSAKQAQATINRQLKKIVRLVDDLLDITRITQNKIQLQLQRIDLNEIVRNTIEDNHLAFESLNIVLKETLPGAPVMVYADPVRMTQIISNLLQNAAKFSLPGQTVKISVNVDKKNHHAIIQVIDKGVGIEPGWLEHLFKPFMQADRSLDRCKGGLGLGLALVKGLVELHKGNISVSSAGPDQGAEFTVKLPLDMTNIEEIKIESKEIKSINNRCVLIIDDNISVAESLSMVLEMFGHTIYISHTGHDGIQMAKSIKPDCILCDIGLPELDGYQVVNILKADEDIRCAYFIALSGYAQPEDVEKSRAAGFDLHLAKPPDLDLLKNLLLKL